MDTLLQNRRAQYEFHLQTPLKAGIVLEGWEVKALLNRQASFEAGSCYIRIHGDEVWMEGFCITPLKGIAPGEIQKRETTRARKLLLKRSEIRKLSQSVAQKGYTVVPVMIGVERKIKVMVALGKGKKLHDKRETIKDRESDRALRRELKQAVA